MPCQPAARGGGSMLSVSAVSAISCLPSLVQQLATYVDETACPACQQTEQNQPDQQQEVPVDGTKFHAQAHLRCWRAMPHLGSRSAEGHQTACQMQSVHCRNQVEERIGWVGREEIP